MALVFAYAALGFGLAIPCVAFILIGPDWVATNSFLTQGSALLCPFWELFWWSLGKNHNLLPQISATVLLFNAALIAPVGIVHWLTTKAKTHWRFSARAVAVIGALFAGHFIMLSQMA